MYTMNQVQAFYKKTEPKLCKYFIGDPNTTEPRFFIQNPDYNQVVKINKVYEYVPQKMPFKNKRINYSGVERYTERVVDAFVQAMKIGAKLDEDIKELITSNKIDLNLCNFDDVVNLCDKLILTKRYDDFELLYHYGNLDMEKYIDNSTVGVGFFIKYIEDLLRPVQSATGGCVPAIETLTVDGLKQVICIRRLKLTESQQKAISYIRNLDDESIEFLISDGQLFEALFSLGAISLTQQQAKKIVKRDVNYKLAPTIANVSIANELAVETVEENPFEDGYFQKFKNRNVYTQETTSQNEQVAEDFMDEIFAEAQKNIEMER